MLFSSLHECNFTKKMVCVFFYNVKCKKTDYLFNFFTDLSCIFEIHKFTRKTGQICNFTGEKNILQFISSAPAAIAVRKKYIFNKILLKVEI